MQACQIVHFAEQFVNTVKPALKTTSIKQPPLHNDHSLVRLSNIW